VRFDVVVCESISRVARNPSVTFRVEEELREAHVKLWAVDEPWEESFGSIVLRHVNVGLARGYLARTEGEVAAGDRGGRPAGTPRRGQACVRVPLSRDPAPESTQGATGTKAEDPRA